MKKTDVEKARRILEEMRKTITAARVLLLGEKVKRTKAAKLLHTLIDQELDQVKAQVELSRTELHQQVDLMTPDPKAHKGALPWPRGQVVDPKTGGPMPAA